MKNKILVIDDDTMLLLSVKRHLTTDPFDYAVTTTASPLQASELMKQEKYDCVLLDIRIPAKDGIALLKEFVAAYPDTPVIMVSGQSSITLAVECIKLGAYDYVEKPVDPNRLSVAILNAIKTKSILQEREHYLEAIKGMNEFIGESEKINAVKECIARVAAKETTVLILGESGTGKELVARALHYNSPRSGKNLISINCASFNKDLLESELFGYIKGAFTGANETRKGKMEAAEGGTLFLDEIGDMPLELQSKILRVLETKEITKVGGTTPIKVDVRFIAATNKDLMSMVKDGLFREDLYYRLHVFKIIIPPLRERPGDIRPIFFHFLQKFSESHNKQIMKVTASALAIIQSHRWEGNVRELKNFIERIVILGDSEINESEVLSALDNQYLYEKESDTRKSVKYGSKKREFEKKFFEEVIARNNGNLKKSAEELEMDRSNFHKKIKSLGIE